MPRASAPQTSSRKSRCSATKPMAMLKRPVPIWEHLRILCEHGYAEDTILLYEITNQGQNGSRLALARTEADGNIYKCICEFYDKTKRYAQAGAILKTFIASFDMSIAFTPGELREPESFEEYNQLEHQDNVWFSYACVLQKTNKFSEAYAALNKICGPYLEKKNQEMPRLLRQLKKEEVGDCVPPEPWSSELPDENSSRICSSSLGPVMSLLRKNKADEFLLVRYVSQFIGTERRDVFHWLKSVEAVGKNKIYEAIAHLRKMSHQNARVLTEMARLNYLIGKKDEARRLLSRAHYRDPLWIDGMELLAFLLIGEYFRDFNQNQVALEELASMLTREWPHRIETAIVNGFVAHQVDLDLASAFANRAMSCAVAGTEPYVYAVYLKTYVRRAFLAKMKGPEAETHKRETREFLEQSVEAMQNNSDLGLLYVDTLLQEENGHREAKIFATKFLHANRTNVNAKLLKVHVLVNGINRNPEASHPKEMYYLLQEVINEHPHVLSAYCYLITEYSRLKDDARCKEVFERLTASRQLMPPTKTHKYHILQADFLLKSRIVIPAYEHLMAAMATGAIVDPNLMSSYEAEFASSKALTHDYKNLAFLDPILPERPPSTNSERGTVSPALQEVMNDHENEQDSSEGEEDEEEEEQDDMDDM
ncbi:hypothetical protein L5515_012837 [Caenorhabditis briggsae]|uniref:Uncharacterized protein n=1 Tax=Caenorhabditis briggsae TaxID=6238 RepID=A0AAE9D7W2_CAEBR|nr:hypothetical protein L3Y34_005753 [Caenorhabditis briggsae]UMM31306.1 hypothetical protein L5515_012837 [Caenorhabditis briggsae]